jgi:GNAT superfamily N-acetyltransferase
MNAVGTQLPEVTWRKAGPLDAPSLGQAMADATEDYRSFAPPDWEPFAASTQSELLEQLLPDNDYWCLIAEQDRALIGQVAFLPATRAHLPVEEPALAHLRQLFVRRDKWGTGLAKVLHAKACEEAAVRGFSALRLFVPADQARARRFYEREGWKVTRGPFEGGFGLPTVEYRNLAL